MFQVIVCNIKYGKTEQNILGKQNTPCDDPSCYKKRGFELIWWCATCFDNKSLTNQQQIRECKYKRNNKSGDTAL